LQLIAINGILGERCQTQKIFAEDLGIEHGCRWWGALSLLRQIQQLAKIALAYLRISGVGAHLPTFIICDIRPSQ
jgi:hypothetical protein